MSLISIHNFVAPFNNKTHLITIILAAMLFAAFRLSGGGAGSNARHHSTAGDIDSEIVSPEESPAATADMEGGRDADLLDEMVHGDTRDSKKGRQSDAGLDDIERKLGLR